MIKLFIFIMLALIPDLVHAEYYLVYYGAEWSDQCFFCQSHVKKSTRAKHHKHHKQHKHHHRLSGLYVYYPNYLLPCPCGDIWNLNYCGCCPKHFPRAWGDYVVFSTKPTDIIKNTFHEEESSYNPDTSTDDDGLPDMEVD